MGQGDPVSEHQGAVRTLTSVTSIAAWCRHALLWQQRKLKEQEWWLLWQLERELSGRALGGVLAVDGIADEDDDDAGVGRSRPRRRA
jgi:hypothetical protein